MPFLVIVLNFSCVNSSYPSRYSRYTNVIKIFKKLKTLLISFDKIAKLTKFYLSSKDYISFTDHAYLARNTHDIFWNANEKKKAKCVQLNATRITRDW